jgi:hypothetical protein
VTPTMKCDDDKKEDGPPPPPYSPPRPPPSGYRIALDVGSPFPSPSHAKEPPSHDTGGTAHPIFLGSAIFNDSVHPCKIAPRLTPPCRVPYGGSEVEHHGRYDLLPFDPETMAWVPTSLGRIPTHRSPVQGGYEENGARLYHAMATVRDVRVPGKTGEHLVRLPLHAGLPLNDRYSRGGVMWPLTGWSMSSRAGTTYCESTFPRLVCLDQRSYGQMLEMISGFSVYIVIVSNLYYHRAPSTGCD